MKKDRLMDPPPQQRQMYNPIQEMYSSKIQVRGSIPSIPSIHSNPSIIGSPKKVNRPNPSILPSLQSHGRAAGILRESPTKFTRK